MKQDEFERLTRKIHEFIERRGRLYSPIDHPAFASLPAQHGAERFEPIRTNMPRNLHTALDIGTHWGYFAHKLEGLGLEVTAAENMEEYLYFLERLRELYEDDFTIYSDSVFSLKAPVEFDVILALNIFHHFTKTERTYEEFLEFLGRIECNVMFFQSHNPKEGQMQQAFRNFNPEEFCELLLDKTPGLSNFREIARFGSRPMFMLT